MLLTPKTSLTGRPASLSTAHSENQIKQYILEKQQNNKKTALDFLEEFLDIRIPFDKPHLALQDGITLCTLLNKICPGTIKQISKATTPFSKMSNIYNFLNGAAKLGLEDADLFETVDLYEGKDMARVYLTILAVARKLCQAPYPQRTSSSRDKNRASRSCSITDNKVFSANSASTQSSFKPKPDVLSQDKSIPALLSSSSPQLKLPSLSLHDENNFSNLTEKKDSGYSVKVSLLKNLHLATTVSPLTQSVNIPSRAPSRRSVSQVSAIDLKPPTSTCTNNLPFFPTQPVASSTDSGVSEKIKNLKLFFDSGTSKSSLPKQISSLESKDANLLSNHAVARKDIPACGSFSSKSEPDPSMVPQVVLNSDCHDIDFNEFPESCSQKEVLEETIFKMDSLSLNDNSPVPTAEDRVQKPLNYKIGPGGIIEDLDLTIKKSNSVENRRGDVLRLNAIDWELDNETSDEDLSCDLFSNTELLTTSTKGSIELDIRTKPLDIKANLGSGFSSDPQTINITAPNISKKHSRNYSEKPNLLLSKDLPVTRPRASSAGQGEVFKDRVSLFHENSKLAAQYQLGDCIGKGQFGSVYKALNLQTGEIVAIKRIEVDGRSDTEIKSLMSEVDLLKSLSHVRIVSYEGYVQSNSYLNIILEYVENGSLQQLLRSYGAFSETLVASYSYQILEGLIYLHEKQVVHCDLKAANILTTKKGKVKLTDFGVSLNLKVKDSDIGEIAAGTPYWMAPEVITLQGASTASDIWSLGCTIVELLTGKPPYHELNKHAALYKIVEDDCPPTPEYFSDALKNFLSLCFKKNPLKRPTALELSCHEWIIQSHLDLEIGNKPSSNDDKKHLGDSPESQVTESLWETCYSFNDNHVHVPPPTTSKAKLSEMHSLVVPDHNFVKSDFEKPIICKICRELVQEQAMLCLDCKIFCHTWCIRLVVLPCQVQNDEPIPSQPQSSRRWLDKKLGLAIKKSEATDVKRRPFYSDGSINNSRKDLNLSSTPSSSTVPWSSQKKAAHRKKKHNDDCCIS